MLPLLHAYAEPAQPAGSTVPTEQFQAGVRQVGVADGQVPQIGPELIEKYVADLRAAVAGLATGRERVAGMRQPPPDTRDWTFVIGDGCRQCGFAPQPAEQTGARLRAAIPRWQEALSRPDAGTRPAPTVWSVLEYGCHVRDVCQLYRQRLALMVDEDDPLFDDWNQDLAAIEGQYFRQDPAR